MNGACSKSGTQCLQVGKTVSSIDERSGLKNYSDVRFAIGVYKKLEKKLNTLGSGKLNLNGKN